MAKTRIAISPNQKLGTDRPSRATPLAAHSAALRRRTAATTPATHADEGGDDDGEHGQLQGDRQRVADAASATGSPVRDELPRSPCSALST